MSRESTSDRLERKRKGRQSLEEQLAWWIAQVESGAMTSRMAEPRVRQIRHRIAVIDREVPSMRWLDDARSLRPDQGGEWPPAGYERTRMRRAAGERRYYPPQYLTMSGHSYDTLLARLYGRVKRFRDVVREEALPELGSQSIVYVGALCEAERKKIRISDDIAISTGKRSISGVM